jgi:hypothetical protein
VTRKRLVSSALLAVLALGADASHGASARITTVARAVWCCSKVCHRAASAGAATRCCGGERAGVDVSATPAAKRTDAMPVVVALSGDLAGVSPSGVPGTLPGEHAPPPRARGTPVFLLNRSFRI